MRFLSFPDHVAPDDLRVVGTSNGPLSMPLQSVVLHGSGVASYETLYSFQSANGESLVAAYPGSYGQLVAVRSARGGRY